MKRYLNLLTYLFILAFTAACTGNSGSEETIDGPTEGTLTLNSSEAFIEINGTVTTATFTVMKGNVNVTDKASIYQKKGDTYEQLNGTIFTSNTIGEYTFFANYNNEMSAFITVTVVSEIQELPEDPQPERFEGFKQRLLAVQATSLECTYCPMMIAGLTEYAKTEEGNNTQVVAAHGVISDNMVSKYSTNLLKALNILSAPSLLFNFLPSSEILQYSSSPTMTSAVIQTAAQKLLQNKANAGICATVSGNEALGSVNITASIKVGELGKYHVCAWLVEDNIYDKGQQNSFPSLEDSYDFTHHSNVLRYISSTSPITGSNLGGKTECQAGETQMFVHEFNLSDMDYVNLSNMRVLVIVSRNESGSRYTVDNVISCGLNQSVAFEYE